MKKIIFTIMILQGVLLSATIQMIEVKGVKVPMVFEKDSTLPIASLELVFQNSGSIKDGNLSGVASFTSSMLNEGTKKLGSVMFAKKLEESAIHLNSSRGLETFSIELSSLREKFDEGVENFYELLNDPNFSKKSFEKIKLLKLATIEKKKSDFDYTAKLGLNKLRYKDTPLENPSIGTTESLDILTLKDVENFYKENMTLSKVVVIVGGDIELVEAKKLAKKLLSKMEVGESEKLISFDSLKKEDLVEIIKDTEQAYIYFGSPFYMSVDDKDIYKSKVAGFILGSGGFGSRLMEEVRVKRGLAYSAYGRISINKSYSQFSGYLQTKLENQDGAMKLVKEVINEFVKNGVTKDELEQAKKFIIGSEPLRNETLSSRLHRTFQEYYRGLELGHSQKELKMIEKLTLKELNDFIASHKEINNLSFSIVTKK